MYQPQAFQAHRMAREWAASQPSDPYAYSRAMARLKSEPRRPAIATVEGGKIVSLD
jgi:hypothetical protein